MKRIDVLTSCRQLGVLQIPPDGEGHAVGIPDPPEGQCQTEQTLFGQVGKQLVIL